MDPNAPVPQVENVAPAPVPEPVAPPAPEPVTPPTMPNPPVDQPPAPPPAPQTPPEPVKKTSPIFTVALILLLLTILVLGGYYVWTNYFGGSLGKSNNVSATPSPIVETTPNSNSTVWKTYVNSAHGFQINYPSNWEVNEENTTSINEIAIGDQNNKYKVTIDLKNDGVTTPLDKWAKDTVSRNQTSVDGPAVAVSLNSDQTMKIDGLQTVSLIGGNEGGDSTTYYFSYKGDIYSISLHTLGVGYGGEEYEQGEPNKTYSEVLSTFKFVEATPAASPTSSPSATARP